MAAGTTSVDARAVRVDSIGRGVETHKPHRTTHIGVRFWDPEPRAAPVTNGEDRKSPVQEFLRPDETKGWVRRHADRVVGVFVASELAVDRLPQESRQAELPVQPMSGVVEVLRDEHLQP